MSLEPGVRLGPYTITSRLGAGGMGEVYRAVDSRLDRHVAIKVLPAEVSGNPQFQLRFEREARTISQLNHPHICTLHDIGRENGTSYLVMELLEGQTLADRVARGPLPLADVVRYGSQIADALDRAHRLGIIHRDLKPGNIMITKSGAKLLDFGLAKAATISVSADDTTHQTPLTAEGTILGTFQYMAPEQLEGVEADPRSDIFALGAVLYEMVTGRRAFDGKTKTSLIAAIVAGQPPAISRVQPLAPHALEHVVMRCLEKSPDDRWQSARDVAEELKWAANTPAPAEPSRSRTRWALPLLAALVLLGVASALYFRRAKEKPHVQAAMAVTLPPATIVRSSAISPDGTYIAFTVRDASQQTSLWVRAVGSFTPRRLTPADSGLAPSKPFWSPDSRTIGFFDNNRILKMDRDGGSPEVIVRNAGYGTGAAWSTDGTIIFSPRFSEGLYRVSANGGEPQRVTTLNAARRETLHGWPRFSPDFDHYIYSVRTVADAPNEIWGSSLSAPRPKFICKADSPIGVAGGELLFVRNGTIFAQPIDTRSFALTGSPRKITDDIYYVEDAAHADATVSVDGALLFDPASAHEQDVDVSLYDSTGRRVESLFRTSNIFVIRVSPDGSKVAFRRWNREKGGADVYTRDLARGVETRLTAGLSNHENLTWGADSEHVVFSSDRDGMYDVYIQTDDSASPAIPLIKSGVDKHPSDVSPDGRFALISVDTTTAHADTWAFPMSGGAAPRPLVATSGDDRDAFFSPDGTWIVYGSDVSGRPECYIRPFPDGRSIQVSTTGGLGAEWRSDGKAVIFSSADRWLTSVDTNISGTTAHPGKPQPLFALSPATVWWTLTNHPDRYLIATRDTTTATNSLSYISSVR